MGTEIYTIDSRELKPWHELMPNKMKKVLESPGPHDRLLVCMEEDICGVNHDEQELFLALVALSIQALTTLTRKTTTS